MAEPWWAVLAAPVLLTVFAVLSVAGDALLDAAGAGRPVSVGAAAGRLRDVARLLVAQPRRTPAADVLLVRIGAAVVPVSAVLAVLVVPFGGAAAADLSVGVVWFNAMEVVTWAGLWMAGWGQNAVFCLVGGYRHVAQGLAYELPLMFALIAAATGAESLRVGAIAAAQQEQGLWFAVWMPVAFAAYLAGVLAFSFVGPFAYPVGADVAGGVLGELSGPDRLLLLAGRRLWLAAGAAMAVPLFLGGGAGPDVLPGWAWSAVKTAAVLAFLLGVRRRLPVLRADRYVEFAWVVLIPLTIAQALVPALVVLNR
ncbi:NADH-quinone oxidoreductase subunit H [Streptomyces sp. CC210A]|uniref:NADH-quinone oxidoreductase subunit H n=1 Tax=Streptomyces sp. CC210A TaxID=2898184 RepID=UPI001F418C77|nr:NADH-quinone oxidoreductase subunit H [Streptomyces sp. CC210A]